MATLVRSVDVTWQVCAECICLSPEWGHEGVSYNVTMGIRVGLLLRIRGELLLIILHHLEETVPTYSAESITVRVA